jgi:protein-L-isoaspartate(D-aspartate) O-methyltransferase
MEQPRSTPDFPWSHMWPEITDPGVRAAFARVSRAAFVPVQLRQWSQQDEPLPIGEEQTISQPFIVALMTQALHLQPGEKILEIGTGSGFQTAILCELTNQVGEPSGHNVYSLERFPSLAKRAKGVLHELGYEPHLAVSDGVAGWLAVAPFVAIIVSAAPAHLPRPLWEQLAERGRMVIPIGPQPDDQMLWLIGKQAGKMMATRMGSVRFVPLVSPRLADPALWVEIEENR